MRKRLFYEAPEMELFPVNLEKIVMGSVTSDGYGAEQQAGQDFGTHTYNQDF